MFADLLLPRIPFSNQSYTYAFIPQDFLRRLFGVFGMDLPAKLTKPDLSGLDVNYTTPSNIDPSKISVLGEFLSAPLTFFKSNPCSTVRPNGREGFFILPITHAAGDHGWTTVEAAILQLNTSLTPSGHFPVYLNKSSSDASGMETRIGYDAAVCVHKYEPWIIETYNTSTGSSSALQIVEKGDGSTSLLPSGNIRGARITTNRYLNTTGKDSVFHVAHGNGIDRMSEAVTDHGNFLGFYIPSPTVGPTVHPYQTCLLTLTYSTDCFLYGWRWTSGVYRILPRSIRRYPRTG